MINQNIKDTQVYKSEFNYYQFNTIIYINLYIYIYVYIYIQLFAKILNPQKHISLYIQVSFVTTGREH